MIGQLQTLGTVCTAHLLTEKWLLAPSYRVGHQWIETLIRGGQSVVNLRPTTLLRLALDQVSDDLIREQLTLASREIGCLLVESAWSRLAADSYLGGLDHSTSLIEVVYDSLVAVLLAGLSPDDVSSACLENAKKADDLGVLLRAYDELCNEHRLVDEAGVYRRAIDHLKTAPAAIENTRLFLVPTGYHVAGLEKAFLDSIPTNQRIELSHPVIADSPSDSATDIRLLRHVSKPQTGLEPVGDGTVQFFRSVGEVNEIREVFRRCLAEAIPFDEVELLHTDTETYVPLIDEIARRFTSETDRPDGVPITFAEGLPASRSRPGRALTIWQRWVAEGYNQRLLVEMIGEGLLDCGDENCSFAYLGRLLRPIAIGLGADNYLPKLDEQINALRKPMTKLSRTDEDEAQAAVASERKWNALKLLRKLVKQILKLSRDLTTGSGSAPLQAANKFLARLARSVNEVDRYAAEALVEQLQARLFWQDHLGVAFDLGEWLAALPMRTRILGSGPRPGHLHVAHIGAGGHSGRTWTFVVGMDDRRFPGAALQDPILLDVERGNLTSELTTSAARLRHKIDELALTLSRLSGTLTLSWSCQDLRDDRETFPSSFALSAFRLISGRHAADLEAVNSTVGPPVSFAPTIAEKSLDEAERWLWQLSDEEVQGTNQLSLVERHFPHLSRGRYAQSQRAAGFGAFNGSIPQAGIDLNPFRDDAPVLSASTLETVGRCPLAFFFRNALTLFPPEDPDVDPDRWLDAAQFGLLLHDVFRRFMAELSVAGKRPQFERDHNRLAEILREAVGEWRNAMPPPNENALRMQLWQLVRTARNFLQVEEEFCKTSQPRFFEIAIGVESIASGSPLDRVEPVDMTLPSGNSIRTRGQIDRLDETDRQRYAVWDYKLGSGYGYDQADAFRQGRRVQSILYLRMIESALREKLDPEAIVERFGYFFPGVRAHGLRIDWEVDKLAAGMTTVERLCSLVADGTYPATDNVDDCRYCDYATICGDVQRVTAQSKEMLERDDLVRLRRFRELRRG